MGEVNQALGETEETLDDLLDRVDATVNRSIEATQHLAGHVDRLVTEIGKLNLSGAVSQFPAAAREGLNDTTGVVGEAGNTAVKAVEVPVATVEDVVKDTEGVEKKAKKTIRRGFKLKRRG